MSSHVPAHVPGWEAVQVLAEPTRRRVYDAVRTARAPLTRDEVAAVVGIARRLAAFHLDQLADAGLLAIDFARPPGRSGPGAGRPAKRYAAACEEVAASVPARRYDLAARLLAGGLQEAPRSAAAATLASTLAVAEEEGRRLGAGRRTGARASRARTMAAVEEVLAEVGYEPAVSDGCLRLRNCPFHSAVEVAPEVVCGMNERFIAGVLDGIDGHRDVVARLEPSPPDCCVRVVSGRE